MGIGTRFAFAPVVQLRFSFDRGTVRIDTDQPDRCLALPLVRWDPRTCCLRAPANAYRSLRAAARSTEPPVALEDAIFPDLVRPVEVTQSPLRPYQEDALAAWTGAGRSGVIAMPTGSGKTRTAIAAIARVALPALVICPTRVLLAQWLEELGRASAQPIGVLGDGATRVEPVTVATFESAYRRLDDYGDRFALLVVDEVHHFATGARREALETVVAPFRLGLTATLPPLNQREILNSLVGPPVYEIALEELLGRHLAELEIRKMSVPLDPKERASYDAAHASFSSVFRAVGRATAARSFAAIATELAKSSIGRKAIADRQRAHAIASLPRAKRALVTALLVRHHDDRVLVFAATARDARRIAEDNLVPLISADISRSERREIVERFRDGTYRTIVSARVLNEGFDVPEASVAIVAGGALGHREHVQRIGRVLRAAPGKRAIVYELVTRGTLEEARSAKRRMDASGVAP